MKEIKRDIHLNRLIQRKGNGLIKVITGIRRCGKSYLLDPLFKNHLLADGVPEDHIIKIEFDRMSNRKYHHDPEGFEQYVHSLVQDKQTYYILLDEIQLMDDFEWVLNGLLYEKNVDLYVTGSNSKFLSSDIITEFRGRGDQVHMRPLSFSEFFESSALDKYDSWNEYQMYGGMPLILSYQSDSEKAAYLNNLFAQTYLTDIIERNQIKRIEILDTIIDILASSVGSLTNPQKLYDTFNSNGIKELSINTINAYIRYLEDAFIVHKALRYDVKGKKYINTPHKYYFTDLGLRNARINFRQQEEPHIMENIIYNELLLRGLNVDVGIVEVRDEGRRIQTEVDFVCSEGGNRYYIQSALSLTSPEKTAQETRSLNHIGDNFKKIIVVKDHIKPWRTNDGIIVIGIFDFLLDSNSLTSC